MRHTDRVTRASFGSAITKMNKSSSAGKNQTFHENRAVVFGFLWNFIQSYLLMGDKEKRKYSGCNCPEFTEFCTREQKFGVKFSTYSKILNWTTIRPEEKIVVSKVVSKSFVRRLRIPRKSVLPRCSMRVSSPDKTHENVGLGRSSKNIVLARFSLR